MKTGRTSPALVTATVSTGLQEVDFVVKLRGGVDTPKALVNELVAAELADHFGIQHPKHAVVELEAELIEIAIDAYPEAAAILDSSRGANFGSRMLANLITWPTERLAPDGMLEEAAAVFAFDSLIQNPDRRTENPNLGVVDEQVQIYDHELAFSFLFDLFPQASPWDVRTQSYLKNHVFSPSLKGKNLHLESFMERLRSLPDDFAERLSIELPEEWPNDALLQIDRHLVAVREQAARFEEEVRRMVA